jgi:putative transposase
MKPAKGAACFHVMSRTVNGEFLFGPTEKEAFRRMMLGMSQFLGIEVFTPVHIKNYFHVPLKVPEKAICAKRGGGPGGRGKKGF